MPFTFGDLTILVSIVLTAVGLGWTIGRRLQRVETGLKGLSSLTNGILALVGSLIRILHRRKALDDQEFMEVQQGYAQMIKGSVSAVLGEEKQQANPLNPEEMRRLRHYWGKARRGEWFTSDEVEDYNRLVRKMEQERPDDPNIWPLIALGAFLLGLYLGRRKE